MKKSRFIFCFAMVAVLSFGSLMAQKTYQYKTYPNDPLNVREYTLDNGLKVFMSVYKDAPKIQTYIAVRAGSRNDPHETTGLAHYLEHMMFKGTQRLGTTNWEKEKVLIQKIEDLFEAYRMFDDPQTRAAIYHKIDSLSYEASKIAVANEYDKAMTAIGAPPLPHRIGDHLRGEKHVSHQGQPQGERRHVRCPLPPPPLWQPNHSR